MFKIDKIIPKTSSGQTSVTAMTSEF